MNMNCKSCMINNQNDEIATEGIVQQPSPKML
jgi:hypothetical protein